MVIGNKQNLSAGSSAFETAIGNAIRSTGFHLEKINVEFDQEQLTWEWVGYIAPQLGHWVTISWIEGNWHLSAVTDQCGILKIIRVDLEAALMELKLVTGPMF
ncbi:MAG: hypothetical protein AAGB01_08265 [Cyanobacteria bacterium P01_F01_bin.42]